MAEILFTVLGVGIALAFLQLTPKDSPIGALWFALAFLVIVIGWTARGLVEAVRHDEDEHRNNSVG